MGVDTYLILPTKNRETATELLRGNPELDDGTAKLGVDFIALYVADRFAEVTHAPDEHARRYLALLPVAMRRSLRERGVLVVPEVGQSFEGVRFADLESSDGARFLPLRSGPRRKGASGVLLVGLSKVREQLLVKEPELVKDLASMHREGAPIPGSILVAPWVELQRLLYDALRVTGMPDGDRCADAVVPHAGMPLYEDGVVDSAKLVRADVVAATASFLARLPADIVQQVRRLPRRSEAARRFPDSLGPVPSDDRTSGPLRERELAAPDHTVEQALEQLCAMYRALAASQKALLSIRFSGQGGAVPRP